MIEAERSCVFGASRASSVARAAALLLASVALGVLAGCSQLEPVAPTHQPVTDPAELYLRLTLNHRAVNLAADTTLPPESHTLQLVATPYDGTGAPIADAPAATFTLLQGDTSALRVTPDGRLEARRAINLQFVQAELTLGGVRRADTAMVNVLAASPPPVLAALSLQVPADSAVWYVPVVSFTSQIINLITLFFPSLPPMLPPLTLSPRAVDATGQPISIAELVIEYESLDAAVARVDRRNGTPTPLAAGHARIVARTIAFGVVKEDTMTYTVQPPLTADLKIDRQGFYYNSNVRTALPTRAIVAGGIVSWENTRPVLMDVTFEDPTHVIAPPAPFCEVALFLPALVEPCGAGDIPTYSGDSLTFAGYRFRQFPVPGTYPYRSTTTGARGQILVLERVPPPAP